MPLVKVKHKQCREAMTITHQSGLILNEVRCEREPGHPGMHKSGQVLWVTDPHLQSRIENEGESL
jgi:hypothetical protein